ncbi:CDP-diacylglycerol--serine O-phosphatidyltransferase [Clostridium tagluense]|uniref:CDP-diacylglycerol--serine O-phosphatidyltransferase n=1 Tax=Clostridium TaxID=1485 RepID=UPI0013E91A1F|nr:MULTISPECIES: CDP-diacylglycerol--serine O-phosphatidyltransferase [Clostridium]MBU3127015.1 CDP-diacylglycerol--serine O-phosphatidyltransferase [Clostridium tagluense]MBW9158126.1 CDP-diacylglycerol--serine O-phosphatidyltransferase [Clostridium tagluense]MBZ9625323.1 CDP-diacylglycerol--serine O-phosphatidyltransferase [Clostridium sp. FP2]MCB2311017.1 CDP-diacylglycerol--serine O-phosphatidyltransferase [Clostridium tagluense]MCB2316875.1 CDP-diacylglycerol--serine O-phosphatidyltransfe
MKRSSIPNILTFGNLIFGLLSLLMTFQANYMLSVIFILLAGLMDRYDGQVARLLQVSSELGKELDSLADLVSFGVAPSMLIFNLYNFISLGYLSYIIFLVYPVAGAYRLARYNCSKFDNVYTGIPITMAGMLVALYALLTLNSPHNFPLTIIIMFILSYLMISKFQIKKV